VRARGTLLLEEVPPRVLAGLVAEGFTSWRDLKIAAERWSPGRGETTAFIKDMARLAKDTQYAYCHPEKRMILEYLRA